MGYSTRHLHLYNDFLLNPYGIKRVAFQNAIQHYNSRQSKHIKKGGTTEVHNQ